MNLIIFKKKSFNILKFVVVGGPSWIASSFAAVFVVVLLPAVMASNCCDDKQQMVLLQRRRHFVAIGCCPVAVLAH